MMHHRNAHLLPEVISFHLLQVGWREHVCQTDIEAGLLNRTWRPSATRRLGNATLWTSIKSPQQLQHYECLLHNHSLRKANFNTTGFPKMHCPPCTRSGFGQLTRQGFLALTGLCWDHCKTITQNPWAWMSGFERCVFLSCLQHQLKGFWQHRPSWMQLLPDTNFSATS